MQWLLIFFFFKQKTAYEMRISDWSSDVCSSDLRHRLFSGPFFQVQAPLPECSDPPGRGQRGAQWALPRPGRPKRPQTGLNWTVATAWSSLPPAGGEPPRAPAGRLSRSEEHTSELQSLMRNSYAVFCLKQKNQD